MKIRLYTAHDGFTLIELLVVIAIIGILSSVVIAALGTARSKAADAAIKSDLITVRSQAAIVYDTNQNYGNDAVTCTTAGSMFVDSVITSARINAETQSGAAASCYSDDGTAGAGTAASSWAMSVPLKSSPAVSWCMDSTGVSASGKLPTFIANVPSCQ